MNMHGPYYKLRLLHARMQSSCVAKPGALRPERRPLASRNLPQVMNLLNIALGCPEDKAPKPLKQTLEHISADITSLFAELPAVLAASVTNMSKVRLPPQVLICSNLHARHKLSTAPPLHTVTARTRATL